MDKNQYRNINMPQNLNNRTRQNNANYPNINQPRKPYNQQNGYSHQNLNGYNNASNSQNYSYNNNVRNMGYNKQTKSSSFLGKSFDDYNRQMANRSVNNIQARNGYQMSNSNQTIPSSTSNSFTSLPNMNYNRPQNNMYGNVNNNSNCNDSFLNNDASNSFSDTSSGNSQQFPRIPGSNNTHSFSDSKESYKPHHRQSPFSFLLALLIIIVCIFALAMALRTWVYQPYEIPSGSMETTIMTGDMVFAEKVSPYFCSPTRGEIVTFIDPENSNRTLIKRVIATGGQTINIKNNKIYVDNIEIDEPYTNGLPTKPLNNSKITFPYKVPEGSVWVMGDNRTNSQDSRYYGAVPESNINGHAVFVYWPLSDARVL